MSEILEIVKQIREAVDRLEKITTPEKQVDPLVLEMDRAEAKWNELIKEQTDLLNKADTTTKAYKEQLSSIVNDISYRESGIEDICFKQHAKRSVKTDEDGYNTLLTILKSTRNLRYLNTVSTTDRVRKARIDKEKSQDTYSIQTNIKTLQDTKQISNPQTIIDSFFEWLDVNKTTSQRIAAFRARV
jgi:hypothetical protein